MWGVYMPMIKPPKGRAIIPELRSVPLTFMDCPHFENGIHPVYGKVGGDWGEGDYCHRACPSTICLWNCMGKTCSEGYSR